MVWSYGITYNSYVKAIGGEYKYYIKVIRWKYEVIYKGNTL